VGFTRVFECGSKLLPEDASSDCYCADQKSQTSPYSSAYEKEATARSQIWIIRT
jgi:hypothetical protein